jgi:hypothetical protein
VFPRTPRLLIVALWVPLQFAAFWFLQKAPIGPVQNGIKVTPGDYLATILGAFALAWILAALASWPSRKRAWHLAQQESR